MEGSRRDLACVFENTPATPSPRGSKPEAVQMQRPNGIPPWERAGGGVSTGITIPRVQSGHPEPVPGVKTSYDPN